MQIIFNNKFIKNISLRSILIIKNIIYSFFLKGGVLLVSIFIVPITLNYLGTEEYGIWQVLSSITTWFYFFDMGLANGFRNKFTHAVAHNDTLLARKYLSTTYAIITLICLVFLLLFEFLNPMLNWAVILNSRNIEQHYIEFLVQMIFIFLCLKMIFSILNTTLIAYHKVALSGLVELIGSTFALFGTYILTKTVSGSLFWIGFINMALPVFVLIFASLLFYSKHLADFKPAFKYIDFSLSKGLFYKGFQFFVIQLAVLFVFTSNNMVITQLFGPASVTPFSIINKYFSIPLMGFSIIMAPLWSGFTDAYIKNEISWIKGTVKRLIKFWIIFAFLLTLMVLSLPFILKIWINTPIFYSQNLAYLMAFFVLLSSWNSIFSYFINGMDTIRVQFIGSIFLAVLNVPLSIFLCKYCSMGVEGVILSTILCLLPGAILSPYQYYLLINKKAKGIWLK